jgi:hypothetical protein
MLNQITPVTNPQGRGWPIPRRAVQIINLPLGLLQSANISVKYFSDFYISYWTKNFSTCMSKNCASAAPSTLIVGPIPLRPNELMIEMLVPWLRVVETWSGYSFS